MCEVPLYNQVGLADTLKYTLHLNRPWMPIPRKSRRIPMRLLGGLDLFERARERERERE